MDGKIVDMNDAQLDDLKQYISAAISQSEANIKSELMHNFVGMIEALRNDMNNGFAAIAQIFTGLNDTVDDHEDRLTNLEQQPA